MAKRGMEPVKFPSSPELKRVIAAMHSAGVEIAAIEVEPRLIRVFTASSIDPIEQAKSAFDRHFGAQRRPKKNWAAD